MAGDCYLGWIQRFAMPQVIHRGAFVIADQSTTSTFVLGVMVYIVWCHSVLLKSFWSILDIEKMVKKWHNHIFLITFILCILQLINGETVYSSQRAYNPVCSVVHYYFFVPASGQALYHPQGPIIHREGVGPY